jgi:carbonic anhydrase
VETNDNLSTYLECLKRRFETSGLSHPNILLVTCIDLRYPGLIHEHMESAADGYFHKRYDQLSLAGAGLAGVVDFPPHPKPTWGGTFLEHVALSAKMHVIKAVVVLEHRNCGAYKEFGLLRDGCSADEEERVHADQIGRLERLLHAHFPNLITDFFLLPQESADDNSLKVHQFAAQTEKQSLRRD